MHEYEEAEHLPVVADLRGLQALDAELETLDTAPLGPGTADEEAFFDHVLTQLQSRVGDAFKLGRLASGKILFRAFCRDDEAYFASRAGNKLGLRRFLRARADQLGKIGLSRDSAQDAIRQWIVWRTLPSPAQREVGLAALLQLYRLKDAVSRNEFAHRALTERWSTERLYVEISRHLQLLEPPKELDASTPHPAVTEVERASKPLLKLDLNEFDPRGLRVGDRVHLRQTSLALRDLCDKLDAWLEADHGIIED